MSVRSTSLVLWGGLAAVALVLASCGGDETDPDPWAKPPPGASVSGGGGPSGGGVEKGAQPNAGGGLGTAPAGANGLGSPPGSANGVGDQTIAEHGLGGQPQGGDGLAREPGGAGGVGDEPGEGGGGEGSGAGPAGCDAACEGVVACFDISMEECLAKCVDASAAVVACVLAADDCDAKDRCMKGDDGGGGDDGEGTAPVPVSSNCAQVCARIQGCGLQIGDCQNTCEAQFSEETRRCVLNAADCNEGLQRCGG